MPGETSFSCKSERHAARCVRSCEHGIDIFLGIVLFCRIVFFEIFISCTERCELVEQPLLAGELEAQDRPTQGIDAVAVGVLDDMTDQHSQHRRLLEVEELGWDDKLGHGLIMATAG